MQNLPKIRTKKLGRQKAWGVYFPHQQRPLILLDPRMDSQQHLKILLHEMLHHEIPELGERKVSSVSLHLSNVLWKQGYRRIKE